MKQPQALISLLLDKTAEYGDRSDAAMDLEAYDDDEVETALGAIATDPNEDPDLIDQSGESLAGIWCRKGRLDETVLKTMQPAAYQVAIAIIEQRCPDLVKHA